MKRLFVFLAISVCVWICAAFVGGEDARETVGLYVAAVGLCATSGACVSLALQKRARRSCGVIGAYVVSFLGRTAAPLCATLIALSCCGDDVRRAIAVRVLIGYFGIVPFHVRASIPSEKEAADRAGSRSALLDRCENDGSCEDSIR